MPSTSKRKARQQDRRRVRQTLRDVWDHGARVLRGYGVTNVSTVKSENTDV